MTLYEKFKNYWMCEGRTIAKRAQDLFKEWILHTPEVIEFGDETSVFVHQQKYVLEETADYLKVSVPDNPKARPEYCRAASFLMVVPRILEEFQQTKEEPPTDLKKLGDWIAQAKACKATEHPSIEEKSIPENTIDASPEETRASVTEVEEPVGVPDSPAILDFTPLLNQINMQQNRIEAQDQAISELRSQLQNTLKQMAEQVTNFEHQTSQPSPNSALATIERSKNITIPTEMIKSLPIGEETLDYLNWVDQLELFQNSHPGFSLTQCHPIVIGTKLLTYLHGRLRCEDQVIEHIQVGVADILDPLAGTVSFAMALKRLTVMFGFGRDLYRARAERESKPAVTITTVGTPTETETNSSPSAAVKPPQVEFKRPRKSADVGNISDEVPVPSHPNFGNGNGNGHSNGTNNPSRFKNW